MPGCRLLAGSVLGWERRQGPVVEGVLLPAVRVLQIGSVQRTDEQSQGGRARSSQGPESHCCGRCLEEDAALRHAASRR